MNPLLLLVEDEEELIRLILTKSSVVKYVLKEDGCLLHTKRLIS